MICEFEIREFIANLRQAKQARAKAMELLRR